MGAGDLAAKPRFVLVSSRRWNRILEEQIESGTAERLGLVVLDEFKQALERALDA